MPRNNNPIPDTHSKKDKQRLIKVNFDQPLRKRRRQLRRLQKAKKLFPRPVNNLKPAVHPPNIRYNSKLRLGRGFTLTELKAVNLHPRLARTIGISVDRRRRNHCEESLKLNVQRLKEYKAKLLVFKRPWKLLSKKRKRSNSKSKHPKGKKPKKVEGKKPAQDAKETKPAGEQAKPKEKKPKEKKPKTEEKPSDKEKKPAPEKKAGDKVKKPVAEKKPGDKVKKPAPEKKAGDKVKKPVPEKKAGDKEKKPTAEKKPADKEKKPQTENKPGDKPKADKDSAQKEKKPVKAPKTKKVIKVVKKSTSTKVKDATRLAKKKAARASTIRKSKLNSTKNMMDLDKVPQIKGQILPLQKPKITFPGLKVSDIEPIRAYYSLRAARALARSVGARKKDAEKRAAEAAAK